MFLCDTEIPYLALYGEKDKNINPHQALEAFNRLKCKMGKDNFEVYLIPGADHNMVITETGCIQDQLNGYRNLKEIKISEKFYTIIRLFLIDLFK